MSDLEIDALFKAIAPEYAGSGFDAQRAQFITISDLYVGSVFGEKYNLARAYVAAHLMTISNANASLKQGGAIVSKKEGQLQVNYAAPTSSNSMLNGFGETVYGRMFLDLGKSTILGYRNYESQS